MKFFSMLGLFLGLFIGGVVSAVLSSYLQMSATIEDLSLISLMFIFGLIGHKYCSK